MHNVNTQYILLSKGDNMHIILSNSKETPIYQQIFEQIKSQVINEELEADQPLPSIRLLAKELEISVITSKRAYEELEKLGYIYTLPGKGSFVKSQNYEMLREKKLSLIEESLEKTIVESRNLNLTKKEFLDLIDLLWEEGK